MNKALRVVFMGTPEFAVASLEAIHQSQHKIVGVVSTPDKPAGRGKKLRASAVKNYAIQHALPILQPEKLRNPEFIQELQALKADIFVVVAFRMLPKIVWDMPSLGTFNLHASLLPQYRGAAPINYAIINGEKESGITTFFINENIDTGDIIEQVKVKIDPDDDAGVLHDKLMKLGSTLVVKSLDLLTLGNLSPQAQVELVSDEKNLKPAPKIFKEDCKIKWTESGQNIHNLIRGLSPYPGAFTRFQMGSKTYQCKIFKSSIETIKNTNLSPGTITTDEKTYLKIACSDAILNIHELQWEGKKRMKTEELLRGLRNLSEAKIIL